MSRPKGIREQSDFEYDVALSFAGENRSIAKQLSRLLDRKGYRVFYYENRRAHLWGRDSKEFERVYSTASRYVIPFVSADYACKDWTQWEFETAKAEAKRRTAPFLLPIRLDDTHLFGMRDDVLVADLRFLTLEEIASDFDAKMKDTLSKVALPARPHRRTSVHLLSGTTRRVLGLIASSGIPLQRITYERFFPEVRWDREVRALRRRGFLVKGEKRLQVKSWVLRVLRRDNAEMEALARAWLEALRPHEGYVDVPVLSAYHHIGLGQLDDAITTLSEAVESVDTGWWNELYLSILQKLAAKRMPSRIAKPSRVRLYNALGLCFANAGNHEEAIGWFRKLRRYARRVGDDWGLGQSYINQGITEHNLGDDVAAERLYRSAVDQARRTGDDVLLGRSLTNLGQLATDTRPDEAQDLLAEGLRAKKRAKDHVGIVMSRVAMGNLYVALQRPKDAAACYRRAARNAAQLGAPYYEALGIHNHANCLFDMMKWGQALGQYRRAKAIAEEHRYPDILQLSEHGLARASFVLKHYRRARRHYKRLYELQLGSGDRPGAAISLHDVGACQLASKDFLSAAGSFRRALRMARSLHDPERTVQCLVDLTVARHGGELSDPAIRELRTRARREQGERASTVAAQLWKTVATAQMDSQALQSCVSESLSNCLSCLEQSEEKNHVETVRAWGMTYLWCWQQRDYPNGLEALETMERVARDAGLVVDRIHAIDQHGVSLQELGRFQTAIKMHSRAASLATKARADSEAATSLSNLGEALRKAGRLSDAIDAFLRAESILRHLEDLPAEIMVKHNRALALVDNELEAEAEKLLVKCRDTSRRHGLWGEHVRAWEGLANLSACEGREALAERRYQRAIKEAKTHGQKEALPRVSLNLARLLHSRGEYRRAVRILLPHKGTFADYVDAHLYYITLGGLYQDLGELEIAASSWRKAQSIAESNGSTDDIALCAGALADVYEAMNKPSLSDEQLRAALENEHDPKLRGCLLVQRLALLLEIRREKEAEEVFEEARELSLTHRLPDVHIDIHMMYGDYAWGKDRKHKREALKAYLVALVRAVEMALEEEEERWDDYAELSGHIMTKLVLDGGGLKAAELDVLCQDADLWLAEQTSSKEVTRLLVCPIRAAVIALPYVKKPAQLQRVLEEYIEDIVRSTDPDG